MKSPPSITAEILHPGRRGVQWIFSER